jgi:DNA-directed RNA polymerase subunit RPC12/RpoP
MAADSLCGYCPHRIIVKNEPALFITLPGVKRERVRCQNCAGEAVPDLPARIEIAGVAELAQTGFTQISKPKVKEWMPYRDAREPGEEG